MKRPSPTSRRLLSLTATLAVGVLAALAVAAPASAHDATVMLDSKQCQPTTGKWKVEWTITNDYSTPMEITKLVSAPDSPLVDEATHSALALHTMIAAHATVHAVQLIDGKADALDLTLHFVWHDRNGLWDGQPDYARHVTFDVGNCTVPASPSPSTPPSPSHHASPSPSSGGGTGGGGGLPVTGVSGLTFAGVALVLIGGGTGLVLLGRRRRGGTTE